MVTGTRPATTLTAASANSLRSSMVRLSNSPLWCGHEIAGAPAHMEIEQPLECRQIEAEIVLERRDRALHHAAEFVLHDGSRQNRGGSPAYAWPMMFARSALPTGRGWVILTAETT